MSIENEIKAQIELAQSLRGKFVRFNHESKTSPGYLVKTEITKDGMIELVGMAGQFAPHLFERVDHPHTAAEGNC